MTFFNSAVTVLQTLVVALGVGLGIWGAINLLEGYGNDNPRCQVPGHEAVYGRWRCGTHRYHAGTFAFRTFWLLSWGRCSGCSCSAWPFSLPSRRSAF